MQLDKARAEVFPILSNLGIADPVEVTECPSD